MAPAASREPQSANDYDDRATAAVKAVLVEIGQILGGFRRKFVVVGGSVPWILLDESDMPHVGTIDVDLSLDAKALGDGEYATLVGALMSQGYEQRKDRRRFQLVRRVAAADGGESVEVIVDFLMPRDARTDRSKPPLIDDFAVQRAHGADLALRFHRMVEIEGTMPDGGRNRVKLAFASVPAFLAMKGFAINDRLKQKDAYDIYYCVRNHAPGNPRALAEDCRLVLDTAEGRRGYGYIREKFDAVDGFGPTSVRRFVEGTGILEGRTPDQWQQDAFGQVDVWLRALGLRS